MSEELIQFVEQSGITIAYFPKEKQSISEVSVREITDSMLDAIKATSPKFILDLSHVDFFGSSFIETMFRVWNRIQGTADGKFAICGLQPYCQEVLNITNLTSVWPTYPTREEAIEWMSSPS